MATVNVVSVAVSFGVFWKVWSAYGFWWGVLYGAGWQVWVGYRLASYLLGDK